jgi:pyruvate dehydrogenase E1 component alpha subunit
MSVSKIIDKADGYGIAGEFVDGMDVMAVRDAVQRAVERGRKDGSPTLLEIRAYRYRGHSMSDPGYYRTQEEVKKYQERDPILLFIDSLKEAKVITDKTVEEIETRAAEKVEECVKFAEESPFPDESELMTDVFVE